MSVSTRIKRIIARQGVILAIIFALIGASAFGGAVITYTSPPVKEVTEQTDQQQISSSVQTSAIVSGNTTLYDRGRKLKNMPVYFLPVSPNMTVQLKTTVPSNQRVTITHRFVLAMEGTRNGQTFWQSRRVLAAEKQRISDGVMWSNATMNMSTIQTQLREKRAVIGDVGTLRTVLRYNVSYQTNKYTGEIGASAPVVITERAYWLDGDLSASRTHSTTITRRMTESPNMIIVTILTLVGTLFLGGAGLILTRYRDLDLQALEIELTRRQYDEWISNGEIPTKSGKEYIRTDTLEDLVDIAIDSNKRVIYDDTFDAYAVVEGDIVYYFTTSDTQFTDWFDV